MKGKQEKTERQKEGRNERGKRKEKGKSNSGRSSQFKCHKVIDLWSIKIGNLKKLDFRIQNSNQTFGFMKQMSCGQDL